MNHKLFALATLLILLASLLGVAGILAQGPEPPRPARSLPDSGPYQTSDGTWAMPDETGPFAGTRILAPQATGGPDDFGYTWDDSVSLNWVDATDGTDTGMSGRSSGQSVGPIPLPFAFKYYENTYNQVYIAASGYLAFTDEGY